MSGDQIAEAARATARGIREVAMEMPQDEGAAVTRMIAASWDRFALEVKRHPGADD